MSLPGFQISKLTVFKAIVILVLEKKIFLKFDLLSYSFLPPRGYSPPIGMNMNTVDLRVIYTKFGHNRMLKI